MKTKLSIFRICIALVAMVGISLQAFAQTNVAAPKIEVKDIATQKALTIKVTTPSNTISQKMSELYGKLFAYMGAKSLQPVNAPFAIYYSFEPNGNTEFEVGIPVGSSVEGTDEVKFKEYPAMKVISTVYVGPYQSVAPTYEALKKYAANNKLETHPISWEIYLTDPSQVTDPAKYQTMIYLVVK